MSSEPILIGNRYELDGLLGRGGMAEVRRAVDTRLGRPVAVKQLRADLATDPTFQARFRREAQSAAGLNHPTIVAVYDTGEEPDPVTGAAVPYIVMELVEGTTLRDVLRDGRKILPERALELTQGVLDALSYSHKAGIVHRDIKPANVMLTPSGDVKVMDFGIARAVADTSATMTQTAAVIGTAQYLSPEQARGETVDARSDLYSAGCLLYELLVGRPPFVGESPVSVAYQHVREAPVPPSDLDTLITPEIDAITLKALAKDPGDRYQTAREMKNDITRLLAGQQVTAVVPTQPAPPEPTPTRMIPSTSELEQQAAEADAEDEEEGEEEKKKGKGGKIALITLLVLALLGGLGFGAYSLMNREQPPPEPEQVEVPNVINYTQQQAEDQLTGAKLTPVPKKVRGPDDNTVGDVTRQTPVSGERVDVGTEVTIEVNVGPEKSSIPSGLVGKDRKEAEKILSDEGFENVTAEAASDEPKEAQENEVTAISPDEGSEVSLDTTITLTYATGQSEVPNWSGVNRDVVESSANEKGFTNVKFKEEESDEPVGTVIRQDPAPFSMVDRDAEITVVLAKEKPEPSPSATPEDPPEDSPSPDPSETPG